jgi:hypothetical protein
MRSFGVVEGTEISVNSGSGSTCLHVCSCKACLILRFLYLYLYMRTVLKLIHSHHWAGFGYSNNFAHTGMSWQKQKNHKSIILCTCTVTYCMVYTGKWYALYIPFQFKCTHNPHRSTGTMAIPVVVPVTCISKRQ